MARQMVISNRDDLLQFILFERYADEFVIIDGLHQHPDGISFNEWLERILEKS